MHRQGILNDIRMFTSQPKARFYDTLLFELDTSIIAKSASKTGRKSQREALFCSFIVMKCESFSQITDLVDYLNNNLLIAHYCGFDITKPLPSYWTFDRFIRNLDNRLLKTVMEEQVLRLASLGIIDTSFIGLDSTSVYANTCKNNPKAFEKEKVNPTVQPKADKDCRLGVFTAPKKGGKNYEFYWGYKNHILCDLTTGLPIYEMTTAANCQDSTVTLEILSATNRFLPITGCTFVADKGYDVKYIYNTVREKYSGNCVIPLKNPSINILETYTTQPPVCEAGLTMWKNGVRKDGERRKRHFCCPLRRSKKKECPVDHKNWNNGKKHRGCSKSITVPEDYRLTIARNTVEYKTIYAMRTECERYNSRFKATGQARLWIRNGHSAANLNTVAHIALLAIAVAATTSKPDISYRSLKSAMRSA